MSAPGISTALAGLGRAYALAGDLEEADVALRGGDRSASEYREVLSRTRDAAGHTARIVDDLLFVGSQNGGEAAATLFSLISSCKARFWP